MNIGRIAATLAAAAVLAAVSTTGWAHQTDESEQFVEIRPDEGEAEQLLMVSAADLAHHLGHVPHHQEPSAGELDEIRGELLEYIEDNTGVRADGELCELADSEFVEYPGDDGRVHSHQLWECPVNPEVVEVANRVMLDTHDGYRHTARIEVDDEVRTTVFDPNYPTYEVPHLPPPPAEPRQADDDDTSPGGEDRDEADEAGDSLEETDQQPGAGPALIGLVLTVVVLTTVAVLLGRRRN